MEVAFTAMSQNGFDLLDRSAPELSVSLLRMPGCLGLGVLVVLLVLVLLILYPSVFNRHGDDLIVTPFAQVNISLSAPGNTLHTPLYYLL